MGLYTKSGGALGSCSFHCWGEEILDKSRRKGRAYLVVFLWCEYSLRATQATDSSLKRAALKEDLTEHQPVIDWYQGGMASLSGGSDRTHSVRTACDDDQLR